MNKEYIKELFEKNKEKLIESEYEITSPEELEIFMENMVISNMQYDFYIYPEADKLFNRIEKNNKDLSNDNIDIER